MKIEVTKEDRQAVALARYTPESILVYAKRHDIRPTIIADIVEAWVCGRDATPWEYGDDELAEVIARARSSAKPIVATKQETRTRQPRIKKILFEYFKESGKVYTEGSVNVDFESTFEAYNYVRNDLIGKRNLPGLSRGVWEGHVYVTCIDTNDERTFPILRTFAHKWDKNGRIDNETLVAVTELIRDASCGEVSSESAITLRDDLIRLLGCDNKKER